MKIAYVCTDPGIPVFGNKGASVHVREVIHALRKRGATVTLFARRLGGQAPPALADLSVIQLPPVHTADEGQREQALLAANESLPALLEQHGPFDLIYERHALWSCAAMEYARRCQVPGILEVNAPLIQEQATYRTLINEDLACTTAARALRAASTVAIVSDQIAPYIRALVPGQAIITIPNGVDCDRFGPSVAPAIPSQAGHATIGFLGTLKPWHGLETLVHAAAIAHARSPLRLLIVGDGPERATIEALAATHAIPALFTGAIDAADIPSYLAAMDIAVAPYPPLEGFYFSPLKLYEYMAAARPIIASRIGQIPEILEHRSTALLVEPGDAAALAAAITELASDPALRRDLGDSARARALQRHTWDAVAARILALAARQPAEAAP